MRNMVFYFDDGTHLCPEDFIKMLEHAETSSCPGDQEHMKCEYAKAMNFHKDGDHAEKL